jgi:Transcription factor/nuclear export subunit protein 2
MSLYDINPPFSRYDQENTRLRTLSKEANDNILALKDVSANKARRERLNSTIDSLSREMRDHIIAREFTIKRLQREKSHWFNVTGTVMHDQNLRLLTSDLYLRPRRFSSTNYSVLHSSTFLDLAYGRRLLCPNDPDFARNWNPGFFHIDVL